MVMQNSFRSNFKSDCVLKFDLKGSIIARNVTNFIDQKKIAKLNKANSESEFFSILKTSKTLKDVNLINLNQTLKKIQLKHVKCDHLTQGVEGMIKL